MKKIFRHLVLNCVTKGIQLQHKYIELQILIVTMECLNAITFISFQLQICI